jgi:hypothetical protein
MPRKSDWDKPYKDPVLARLKSQMEKGNIGYGGRKRKYKEPKPERFVSETSQRSEAGLYQGMSAPPDIDSVLKVTAITGAVIGAVWGLCKLFQQSKVEEQAKDSDPQISPWENGNPWVVCPKCRAYNFARTWKCKCGYDPFDA